MIFKTEIFLSFGRDEKREKRPSHNSVSAELVIYYIQHLATSTTHSDKSYHKTTYSSNCLTEVQLEKVSFSVDFLHVSS